MAGSRSNLLVCLALTLAAQTTPVLAQSDCTVNYERVSEVQYSVHQLEALVIRGTHAGAAFSLVDDDGLLTLATLYSGWQVSGLTRRNLTEPVSVRRSDILLAQRAGQIGLAYYATLIDIYRAQPAAERSQNYDQDIAMMNTKMAAWAGLAGRLERISNQSGFSAGGVVELPARFMRDQIGTPILARIQVGAPNRWLSRYGNARATGDGRQVLCDPASPSALFGRLLCARSFSDDTWLGLLDCPDGPVFPHPVSTVPFCREDLIASGPNGEARVERVNCTRGLGGVSIASDAS